MTKQALKDAHDVLSKHMFTRDNWLDAARLIEVIEGPITLQIRNCHKEKEVRVLQAALIMLHRAVARVRLNKS